MSPSADRSSALSSSVARAGAIVAVAVLLAGAGTASADESTPGESVATDSGDFFYPDATRRPDQALPVERNVPCILTGVAALAALTVFGVGACPLDAD